MTLRTKTLIIVGATLIGLLALVYISSRVILLGSFQQLEEDLAQQNLERALNAISAELDAFERSNQDWAYWDDTYNFIQTGGEDYRITNLTDSALETLNINFVVYMTSDGEAVFETGFDLNEAIMTPLPESLRPYLAADGPLRELPDLRGTARGIVLLDDGPALVVSHNILTGEREGPVYGTLIWGRLLNDDMIARLAESTRLSLQIHPAASLPADEPDFAAALDQLGAQESFIQTIAGDRIAAYTTLSDVYGAPALLLRVDMPRSIYDQGQRTIFTFVLSLLVAGLAFGVAVSLLLEQAVVSRVTRLSYEVDHIGQSGDLSTRVTVKSDDELSSLSRRINTMLEALQSSQDTLRESEERLGLVVRSAPVILFALNITGTFTLLAGRKLELLGITPHSIVGRSVYHTSIVSVLPEIARDFERARGGQTVISTVEISGSSFDVISAPLRSAAGVITGVIGMAIDITERKQAEAQLQAAKEAAEQASRAKSAFLANMSHELRTPLNAIIGYSELMTEEFIERDQTAFVTDMNKIRDSGTHLLRLINDVLDISKIEAGKMEMELTEIDLKPLVSDVANIITPLAENRHNRFSVEWQDDITTMLADPTKVRQILLNLLNNANKFTENGRVTLSIEQETIKGAPWVLFKIIDTGIGMGSEQISRLFKPFSQGDSSTTRRYGGTGLGLSISREFCLMMGGDIAVTSETGHGSTFTVMLPQTVQKPDEQPIPAENEIG